MKAGVEHDTPAFVELTIAWPNFWMRFKATQERVSRVMVFMLKEATEAEAEYEQSLKPKEPKIESEA